MTTKRKEWSREGYTYTTRELIVRVLKNFELRLTFADVTRNGLAVHTTQSTEGRALYSIQGGIGAFIEDAKALEALLALGGDPDL